MSRFAQIAGLCLSSLTVAARAGGRDAREPAGPAPLAGLEGFDGIALTGSGNVQVRIGGGFSVQVDGDADAVARLDIFVQNHVLHIQRCKLPRGEHAGRRHGRPAMVRVTMPRLRSAVLSGSGRIQAEQMAGHEIIATLSGSGDLTIAGIRAAEARLSVAGSGTLTASGEADETRLSLAGSGDLRAGRLRAVRTRVSVTGSGEAVAHAREEARVSIAGSGDATIHGIRNCRTSKAGSGEVRCAA